MTADGRARRAGGLARRAGGLARRAGGLARQAGGGGILSPDQRAGRGRGG
jgi:hypothetical protein